jgi:eukaryotic-like serine/threonine-protein kinase
MALTSGTKLGPYEILSPLGAGGMGEVYRARDTRLERTVAIKVLPSHLSSDPDLKHRFEREARTISSLNHPHICHLYDVGSQDGTDYLVMELWSAKIPSAFETRQLRERAREGFPFA